MLTKKLADRTLNQRKQSAPQRSRRPSTVSNVNIERAKKKSRRGTVALR